MTHLILVTLGLALLGGCWWWTTQRLSPLVDGSRVSASKGSAAPAAVARAHESTAHPVPKSPATPGRQPQQSPERRAQTDRLVVLERNLAREQEAALAGLAETEYPSALAAFAESRHDEITAAATARDEWTKPPKAANAPGASAPLLGAEALRVRFDAVRRSIIEDGLSIEEAESRFHAAPAGP